MKVVDFCGGLFRSQNTKENPPKKSARKAVIRKQKSAGTQPLQSPPAGPKSPPQNLPINPVVKPPSARRVFCDSEGLLAPGGSSEHGFWDTFGYPLDMVEAPVLKCACDPSVAGGRGKSRCAPSQTLLLVRGACSEKMAQIDNIRHETLPTLTAQQNFAAIFFVDCSAKPAGKLAICTLRFENAASLSTELGRSHASEKLWRSLRFGQQENFKENFSPKFPLLFTAKLVRNSGKSFMTRFCSGHPRQKARKIRGHMKVLGSFAGVTSRIVVFAVLKRCHFQETRSRIPRMTYTLIKNITIGNTILTVHEFFGGK